MMKMAREMRETREVLNRAIELLGKTEVFKMLGNDQVKTAPGGATNGFSQWNPSPPPYQYSNPQATQPKSNILPAENPIIKLVKQKLLETK